MPSHRRPPFEQWPYHHCSCGAQVMNPIWRSTENRWCFYSYCYKCKNIRSRYNVSGIEEVRVILGPEPSHCPVCKRSGRQMVIDHDHSTGRLRSWLCSQCNTLVGLGGECPTVLDNARTYIVKQKAMSTMEAICSSMSLSSQLSLGKK